jgi:hypothetical protein
VTIGQAMEWREIPLPALDNVRSTGAAQPLPRELWPTWAHDKPDFVGVWFMPLDAPLNTSTESLTPSGAQASLDPERIDSGSTTPLVYYRYGVLPDDRRAHVPTRPDEEAGVRAAPRRAPVVVEILQVRVQIECSYDR